MNRPSCYELWSLEPHRQPRAAGARRTLRAIKLATVLAVVIGLVAAERLGVFHRFSDPELVKATFAELGAWGFVAFVLAYAALQPFGIPGTVFVVAASLIWPWPVAFAVSMVGTMAASVVGFSFARFVARDWVASIIPARFHRYDDALAQRAFVTVFLLRLVFWMPPVLHAFFGVSKVRFWTHFWGSLAGYVLPLLFISYFGERLFDALRAAPREVWIAAGLATCALALGVWALRRARSRSRQRADDAVRIRQ